MLQFLARWAASAVAFYITVVIGHAIGLKIWLAPGAKGVVAAIIGAAVLGIVNAVIRPILKVLAFPITCLTFGLFTFVINAFTYSLVGYLVPNFNVRGPIAALFGSIVITVVSGILHLILSPVTDKREDDEQ